MRNRPRSPFRINAISRVLTTLTNVKIGLVLTLGVAGVATTLVFQHNSILRGSQQAAKSGSSNLQVAGGRFVTNGNPVAAIVNGKPILELERERGRNGVGSA